MSYDYDWCGHTADEADARPCGAPIERWSREWKHRKFELDQDHKAVQQEPVGPLEEGLHLRADRYATALAAAVAADERIAALTELLRQHEYYRSQAESALSAVQEDPDYGTVWAPTGPEPEDANALLCLITGNVYYRRRGLGMRDGWRRAEASDNATTYEWPISDAGPFIAWRDGYGFDQVLQEARRRNVEFDQLHRQLYSKDGYRDENGGFGRPNLAEAIERILRHHLERVYQANERAQAAQQKLNHLRRLIGYLTPDDTQQWPAPGDDGEVRDVAVIDLDKVQALLDRADCGGAA